MDKTEEIDEFEGSAYPAGRHEENEIVIRLGRAKELLSVYYYRGFGDGRAEEWTRSNKVWNEKLKAQKKDLLKTINKEARKNTLKELIKEYTDNELEGKGYDFYFSIRAKIDDLNKK